MGTVTSGRCVPAVAGVLLVAGCGGAAGTDSLKAYHPSSSTTATAPAALSAEQQAVIAAYGRYRDLSNAISGGAKVDMVKMHEVAQDPWALKYAKNLDATQSAGYIQVKPWGRDIRSTTVTGSTAVLVDCVDTRGGYSVRQGGQASLATATPAPPLLVTVRLVRTGGRWLVTGQTDGAPCTPGAR